MRPCLPEDLSVCMGEEDLSDTEELLRDSYVRTRILKVIHDLTGSQWTRDTKCLECSRD